MLSKSGRFQPIYRCRQKVSFQCHFLTFFWHSWRSGQKFPDLQRGWTKKWHFCHFASKNHSFLPLLLISYRGAPGFLRNLQEALELLLILLSRAVLSVILTCICVEFSRIRSNVLKCAQICTFILPAGNRLKPSRFAKAFSQKWTFLKDVRRRCTWVHILAISAHLLLQGSHIYQASSRIIEKASNSCRSVPTKGAGQPTLLRSAQKCSEMTLLSTRNASDPCRQQPMRFSEGLRQECAHCAHFSTFLASFSQLSGKDRGRHGILIRKCSKVHQKVHFWH